MPRPADGSINTGGTGRKLWDYLPCFTEITYWLPLPVASVVCDGLNCISGRPQSPWPYSDGRSTASWHRRPDVTPVGATWHSRHAGETMRVHRVDKQDRPTAHRMLDHRWPLHFVIHLFGFSFVIAIEFLTGGSGTAAVQAHQGGEPLLHVSNEPICPRS